MKYPIYKISKNGLLVKFVGLNSGYALNKNNNMHEDIYEGWQDHTDDIWRDLTDEEKVEYGIVETDEMTSRNNAIDQNGNDGDHYVIKVGDYVTIPGEKDLDGVYKVEKIEYSYVHDVYCAIIFDILGVKFKIFLGDLKLAGSHQVKEFLSKKNAKATNKRDEILDTAKKIINGQREDDYGSAEDNFKTIAKLWSEYLSSHINPKDVAMMMILLKVARMGTGAGTEDCLIDICGYAALAGEM